MQPTASPSLPQEPPGISTQQQLPQLAVDAKSVDSLQRLGILDDERVIGSDAKLRPAERLDEMSQGRRIVDKRVVVKASRLFDGCAPARSRSGMAPAEHKARQGEGEASAAVADRNPQPGVPLQPTAGDQRRHRQRSLAGKG